MDPTTQPQAHSDPPSNWDPRAIVAKAIASGLLTPAKPVSISASFYNDKRRAARSEAGAVKKERSLALVDGRKILCDARRTDHHRCMQRWALRCCREYLKPALQVIADNPDLLCPKCAAFMAVRYETPKPILPKEQQPKNPIKT
jgi:hypothetical protein